MYKSLLMLPDTVKGLMAMIEITEETDIPSANEKVNVDGVDYLVVSAYDLRPSGNFMELVIRSI
jgi:hypothetical protein